VFSFDLHAARKITVTLMTHDLRTRGAVPSRLGAGRIAERKVDVPRPRDLEVTFTPAFRGVVHELREHIVRARR
jgi:NitT/TauT family transport system ATP-binding protein